MRTQFRSFDGTQACEAELVQPDRYRSLHDALDHDQAVAVRGAGLSYCLASAPADGRAVSALAFDRILDFDPVGHSITVESGVRLGDLVRFLADRDFQFPVLPGHPDITVGGCIGFNVHGKTQHDVGNFSDHVEELTLYHPDHGLLTVSATADSDVFSLTMGGFGLTGFVETVRLAIEPLAGHQVQRSAHKVGNLVEAVDVMTEIDEQGVRLYSWNDLQRRGSAFGAGVVFADRVLPGSPRSDKTPSFGHASSARRAPRVSPYNRATWSLVNRALSVAESRPTKTLALLEAAFPISGREIYFSLHGKRGFFEYQLIVPADAFSDAARRVQRLVASTKACVTLGSLKLFRGTTPLLWFRGDGVCLTIDGSATSSTQALFAGLDDLAIELGAPVNVAKDSRLRAETVRAVYPEYEAFREQLRAFDPRGRFSSPLRVRLDV